MSRIKCFFLSLTRITDFERNAFDVEPIPRERWAAGDYVMAEINHQPRAYPRVELNSGRMVEVMAGDRVIGAFGERCATLGGVGTWREIGSDLGMHAMTGAGLFGRARSVSPLSPPPIPLTYVGHIARGGVQLNMRDFVQPIEQRPFATPVVLLVGTSMSAGKTTTGRVVIHELKQLGHTVVGAKLTGAGRYRDVLSFSDAGADHIFDFVDVGLPSTVLEPDEYRTRLRQLLSHISALAADVVVAEAGASPLEPYNGATAIEELGDNVRCTILCASDPYAVAGVQQAFDFRPDLVSGPAANTNSGIDLVKKLTGVDALNLMNRESHSELAALLERKIPR